MFLNEDDLELNVECWYCAGGPLRERLLWRLKAGDSEYMVCRNILGDITDITTDHMTGIKIHTRRDIAFSGQL
jgi:hypothetical protein